MIVKSYAHGMFPFVLMCLAVCSCTADSFPDEDINDMSVPVTVDAYVGGPVTKGAEIGTAEVLGAWQGDSLVRGTGIGLFAFYQKVKSNGSSSVFCKSTGLPNFMYNQKVERVTDDGATWRFEYSPVKYWPNNAGDCLSFFAYAPYDSLAAWEDLKVTSNSAGTRIVRHFEVEDDPADQIDLMWTAPLLNMSRNDCSELSFPFTHLCGALAVYAEVNLPPSQTYVTVDRVTVTGAFNTSVDIVYTPDDGAVAWRDLTRSESRDWVLYKAVTTTNPETGETVTDTWTVPQERSRVGGAGTSLLVLPGTQDITLTAVLSQRSSAGYCSSSTISKSYSSVQVLAGTVTTFTLSVTLLPINFGGSVTAAWGEVENL